MEPDESKLKKVAEENYKTFLELKHELEERTERLSPISAEYEIPEERVTFSSPGYLHGKEKSDLTPTKTGYIYGITISLLMKGFPIGATIDANLKRWIDSWNNEMLDGGSYTYYLSSRLYERIKELEDEIENSEYDTKPLLETMKVLEDKGFVPYLLPDNLWELRAKTPGFKDPKEFGELILKKCEERDYDMPGTTPEGDAQMFFAISKNLKKKGVKPKP